MAGVAEDDPWRDTELVARLEKSPLTGVPPPLEDPAPFYILGLSAESRSRLTARFFHAGAIKDAGRLVKRWFEELCIAPEGGRPLSMVALRRAIAVQGDLKNAPPSLEAELLRSAYTGAPLPQRVLGEVLVRCAAEDITRERAALIKAFLMRNLGEKLSVTLDPDDIHPAYRLGRLFALLENIQYVAVKPKRTIRDSYWGSAAATPSAVFPQLLDLVTSHLGKIKQDRPGLTHWFEDQIGEILDSRRFPTFLPTHHSFEEQGRFALGYWQERYKPKPKHVAEQEQAAIEQTGEAA
jgi:CRISPR-associated protein Csd1